MLARTFLSLTFYCDVEVHIVLNKTQAYVLYWFYIFLYGWQCKTLSAEDNILCSHKHFNLTYSLYFLLFFLLNIRKKNLNFYPGYFFTFSKLTKKCVKIYLAYWILMIEIKMYKIPLIVYILYCRNISKSQHQYDNFIF